MMTGEEPGSDALDDERDIMLALRDRILIALSRHSSQLVKDKMLPCEYSATTRPLMSAASDRQHIHRKIPFLITGVIFAGIQEANRVAICCHDRELLRPDIPFEKQVRYL
jgi:hypothetical protein